MEFFLTMFLFLAMYFMVCVIVYKLDQIKVMLEIMRIEKEAEDDPSKQEVVKKE